MLQCPHNNIKEAALMLIFLQNAPGRESVYIILKCSIRKVVYVQIQKSGSKTLLWSEKLTELIFPNMIKIFQKYMRLKLLRLGKLI